MVNERCEVCFSSILVELSPFRLAPIERLYESLNIWVIMRNKHNNIEKYYCQEVLLRPKLIVININMYNVTRNIPGPIINFLVPQAHDENIFVTYWTLTVLSIITFYR